MFTELLLVFSFLVYLAIPALLWIARKRETDEDEVRLERWAAAVGVLAGAITLLINLLVLLPVKLGSSAMVTLVLLAVGLPAITIVGGVLTWLQRRRGVTVLMIGVAVWLADMAVGLLASVFAG